MHKRIAMQTCQVIWQVKSREELDAVCAVPSP